MAEKRGAGAAPKVGKKSAPSKGPRNAGETTPPRTGRVTESTGTTGETGASAKGTSRRTSASSAMDGRPGRSSGGTGGTGGGAKRGSRAGTRKSSPDLRKDLRDFASARPDGWSHDDWLRFLDDLQARGHNINDRDEIGSMLERERLSLALERIPGVGPQRVKNIADRYGYLWRLRETDADQLAREANVPKPVAEKVIQALRG